MILDIASLGGQKVHEKEKEKTENGQDLQTENLRTWKIKCVEVLPAVIGVFRAVPKRTNN